MVRHGREVRQFLKTLKRLQDAEAEIKADAIVRVDALRRQLEGASSAKLTNLQKQQAEVKAQLAKHNPFPVGTHIQKVAEDGLPGGVMWEVTRVVDHEQFYARLVLANGKLGQTAELFGRGRWKHPKDYRKVLPVKEAVAKKRKAALATVKERS